MTTIRDDRDDWDVGRFCGDQTKYDRIGSTRKFGVELEFDGLHDDVFDLENQTIFGGKEDPSVDGGELVSPILYGDDGLAVCENLCSLLEHDDYSPGDQSGYHLHCDVRNETSTSYKSILLAYHYTALFWCGTVTPQRRSNTYCSNHVYRISDIRAIGPDTEDIEAFAHNYGRYYWINVASFNVHGTIELRIHEGTKDAKDITNWAIAHTRFIDAASDMTTGQITRIFGGTKTPNQLFREIRVMLAAPTVSSHLANRFITNGTDLQTA